MKYNFHKVHKFQVRVYKGMGERAPLLGEMALTPKERTTLPCDHLAVGSFNMDLPEILEQGATGRERGRQLEIKDAFDILSDIPSNEVRPALKKWLLKIACNVDNTPGSVEGDNNSISPRTLTVKEMVGAIMDIWTKKEGLDPRKDRKEYPSTKDLAYIFNVNYHTISNYKREWRELLP